MNLENTKIAYQSKSVKELKKALFIFKLFQYSFLVTLGKTLVKIFIPLHLPLPKLVKKMIFKQFCGGENENEVLLLLSQLAKFNIDSCIHHAAENIATEKERADSFERFLELLDLGGKNKSFSFSVIKPTSLGSTELYEKVSAGGSLSAVEKEEWRKIKKRFQLCCKKAISNNIKLLVDAEESWFQKAIDELLEELMLQFNKSQVWIYTTVQMYRHDRLVYLNRLLRVAKDRHCIMGIKLVRGAYLEKENEYALNKGIPSALFPTKSETDKNFELGLQLILENLNHYSLFLGSHNEKNVLQTVAFMKKNQLINKHPRVFFSQLYGMCDHISFNLSAHGFNVVKYVPYGQFKQVISYLIRRIDENSSVMSQSVRELELYKKELERRYSETT